MGFDPNTGQPLYPAQQQQVYQPPAQQPQVFQPPAQQPQVFQPQSPAYTPPKKLDETLGWVSVGLMAAGWLMQFHLFATIPALIVGIMAKNKIKKDPEKFGGGTMATIGIIGSIVNIVIVFLLVFIWIAIMLIALISGNM